MTESKHRLNGFADRDLSVDGARLHYAVAGDGPPVVLVHGLGGTVENWRGIAPGLAERYRVVVPDLPGHGMSELLPGRIRTLDPYADAVASMLEAESIERAVWVGHSLGAVVALCAAVRRPEAVSGLVLAGAAGIGSHLPVSRFTLKLDGIIQPGKAIAPHRKRLASSALGRRAVFWWGVADTRALEPEHAEAFLLGPARHTSIRQAIGALLGTDARADLEHVTCPSLCLWGASDRWVKLEDGYEYARTLGAPVRTIAGCAHLLIGERPDACRVAIEDFMASI